MNNTVTISTLTPIIQLEGIHPLQSLSPMEEKLVALIAAIVVDKTIADIRGEEG